MAGAVEEPAVNGPIVGVALAEGDRWVEDPLNGLLGLKKARLLLLPLGPATVGLQDSEREEVLVFLRYLSNK